MFTSHAVLHRQSCLLGSPLQQQIATAAPGRRCLRTWADKSGIDFKPSSASENGYMKQDSAGQENIFAVESKAFVGGGSKEGSNTAANAAYAGLAAAVAALAIVGGIFLTKDKAAVPPAQVLREAPKESLSSISRRLAPAVKEALADTPAAPLLAED